MDHARDVLAGPSKNAERLGAAAGADEAGRLTQKRWWYSSLKVRSRHISPLPM